VRKSFACLAGALLVLAGCEDAPQPRGRQISAIEVVDSGFTDRRDRTGRHLLSWGAVLSNSGASALAPVRVRVDALDDAGDTIKSDTIRVGLVPAGGTFNLGGRLDMLSEAAKLAVVVESAVPVKGGYSLPDITPGEVKKSEVDGDVIVTSVTNTLGVTLSEYTGVYAVIRDAGGDIVGGAGTLLPRELPPGRTTRVELTDLGSLPRQASVQLTADNQSTTGY
jgi:hypothetical protein